MANLEAFRSRIIDARVKDPEGVHHELKSGMHGQKLDFDLIETGSSLYREWVDVNEAFLRSRPSLPRFIIGTANGTNRLSLDVARRFDGNMVGLVSEKDPHDPETIRLNALTALIIRKLAPEIVYVLEDVGTTGRSSAQVAVAALGEGAGEVRVLTTWQRRSQLEVLDAHGIPHDSLINEFLDTFSPEDCAREGYCAQGWELVPRPRPPDALVPQR